MAAAYLRLARPKQWIKNVLVFAAPGAAGVLTEAAPLIRTSISFLAFGLAASGTYAWNDALDAESDRNHPTKRIRPVASGAISPLAAKVFGVACFIGASAVGFAINRNLGTAIVAYIVLTLLYSMKLKHEPVLDLVAVASGFVIRTVGGGAAGEVRISTWFLIVAGAGSLFIVTGKRTAEVKLLGTKATSHRKALEGYSDSFLLYVRSVSSSVAILGYCLWAFQFSEQAGNSTWFELSIVPFVVGMLRYSLLLEHGEGGAPEDLVLADPVLLGVGVSWVAVFAAAVYLL